MDRINSIENFNTTLKKTKYKIQNESGTIPNSFFRYLPDEISCLTFRGQIKETVDNSSLIT